MRLQKNLTNLREHNRQQRLALCLSLGVALLSLVLAWLAIPPAPVMAQEPPNKRLDLTGNNVIDDADAQSVAEAWFDLQARGLCMAPEWSERDINGDGCINVSDVQTVLAHWGERVGPLGKDTAGIGVQATKTFTVNSPDNTEDSDLTDNECRTSQGNCTLRAAIQQANARPGPEEIHFNIRNGDGSCLSVVTIRPSSRSLVIDDPRDDGIVIDGYTQCGARPNSQQVGGNAVLKIQIEGGGGGDGLTVYSANNVVRGLALYNWERKIFNDGSGSKNNRYGGNFIGSKANNECDKIVGEGITLETSVTNILVGGTDPADRNIVNCNSEDGIELFGSRVANNRIIGNYVGLKQDGKSSGQNEADGIDVAEGAHDTWIERNVIGRQGRDGIEISHQIGTRGNTVVNNYIGLDASGQGSAGNGHIGITLEDLINNNTIYNNVIVNNGANGIRCYALCNENQIHDNLIGVGLDKKTAMPNGQNRSLNIGFHGIYMFGGSQHNVIRRNIIANNPEHGIYLTREDSYLHYSRDTDFNTFSQNSIYNNGFVGIRLKERNGEFPNQGLPAPKITLALPNSVSGTACAACTVEIFIADNDPSGYGEGKSFIGSGTANSSGGFSIGVNNLSPGQRVTGTATDGKGNTSEFGKNFTVLSAPPPTPTPLPTPTPRFKTWLPVTFKN